MTINGKTVFISYRRDPTGKAFARLLHRNLTHKGYDVFLDVESLESGEWDTQILTRIGECGHFILLITPDSLDRCVNDDDWVRKEYLEAVRTQRNIVPISEETVNLSTLSNKVVDIMKPIFKLQISPLRHMGYDNDLAEIVSKFLTAHKAAPPFSISHGSIVEEDKKPTHKLSNLQYASLGSLFKGREPFLRDLKDKLLNEQKPVAVHGLGGIGKTRAAVEFALQNAHDYTALLFVRADNPESLKTNIAALCGPLVLDLAEKDATEIDVQFAAALQWLKSHPGWFLILDNVDDEKTVKEVNSLLGQLGSGGQVVITSRISDWHGAVETLALDVLTETDAASFLLERTDRRRRKEPNDAEAAKELAVTLGQLALALEQAGAMINERRYTFSQYLQEWSTNHKAVMKWFSETTMQYPMSVAVTWQTSFDQLTPQAQRLLERLAWFAPDPIPESLLEVPVPDEDEAHETAFEALANLETYSLVTRSSEASAFTVHKLVQDVTRQRDDTTHTMLKSGMGWINVAFIGEPWDVCNWPILEPLAPHALACARLADEASIPEPTSRLFNEIAQLYDAKAQYDFAEPLMRRALAIDESTHGPDHPRVAIDLNNLAQLLQATNRLSEAEPLMRRALAIDESTHGPDHPNVARDLNNLAQLLQATNRLLEAEPLMRRALAIDESSYGPDHPNVARDLNNLAQLLKATNRLSEAEPLMRRALAIDESSYGPDHPDVARDLNNLARLLQDANRLPEAEPHMRRSCEIFMRSLGFDHPNSQTVLNNYGGLLMEMGKTEDEAVAEIMKIAPEYGG